VHLEEISMANILVAEDDPQLRSEIAGALRRSGHLVDVASGGNEALARLQVRQYDLLLTDLLMDQGTGFDVLEWVRESAPGLPVLICSSYAKADNLKTFLATQFYRIVRKPFRTDDLVDQVRELLASVTGERN
jgi:two-component system response regulator HydG